jgi:hypothetical protein
LAPSCASAQKSVGVQNAEELIDKNDNKIEMQRIYVTNNEKGLESE